jgi:hypothetical protein
MSRVKIPPIRVHPAVQLAKPAAAATPVWQTFLKDTRDVVYKLPWQTRHPNNCCAVIVEPRISQDMEYILRNVNHFTRGWKIVWFHGKGNVMQAQQLAQKLPGLQLIQLPVYDLKQGYNELLTSKAFWLQIPCENILIFQTDVVLLRTGIEEFLKYDYVGAPWYFGGFGNGGLSFRKKSKMLAVLQKFPYTPQAGNEDIYFVQSLQKMPGSILPTIQKAGDFSVETVFYPKPLGLHNAWNYLSHAQISTFLKEAIYVQ